MPNPEVRYCTTSDGVSVAYSDRGDSTLKGFEDPLRLYEVRWQ